MLELVSASLAAPSLSDLADTANAEHSAALGAVTTALAHALRSGEALVAAQARVPEGEWLTWLSANVTIGAAQAKTYMKLARHVELLPADESLSINAAVRYLRSLNVAPRSFEAPNKLAIPDDALAEAQRLRDEGIAWEAIGRLLGYNAKTIRKRVDPEHSTRDRQYKQITKSRTRVARVQAREAVVQTVGGPLLHALALLKQADAELKRSLAMGETGQAQLHDALLHTHKAVAAVLRAGHRLAPIKSIAS